MAELAVAKKRYTYEDYLKTPDEERYELIEGELIMTPSPKTDHQRISGRLDFVLRKFVMEKDLGEVFYAPYDVYLDEEDCVQPDILFVSKERLNIIGENNVQGAPDLVVEITSKGTAYKDVIQKKMLYARLGVKEYWIVAPLEKMVEVYSLKDREYQLIETCFYNDILKSPLLKGFNVELKEIF
ncbi:MAG: Uma2 family endonuclease [bacterium]